MVSRLRVVVTHDSGSEPHLYCADRLRLCKFRSWPMDAIYSGTGSRYTWHLDNPHRHT